MLLIINNHSDWIRSLENELKRKQKRFILKDQSSLGKSISKKNIRGVILSGGMPNIDVKINMSKIRANMVALLTLDVPILGICLGHQIICESFGGDILKRKSLIEENIRITILKQNKIFKGLPKQITVQESHKRFAKNLSSELQLAATSHEDKIEAVFHKSRPIFGTQFHPEKSGIHGDKIIENFLNICSKY
jgi:GMP synthase (glutamine-hydrolysing)